MSQPDYSGASMLDLFRMEVESHGAVLNDGILALGAGSASPEILEGLMRAAHSIKGAARIVGLQAVVDLAHVMEDCFVAAQKGRITLHADHVETLLRSTDFLLRSACEDNAQKAGEQAIDPVPLAAALKAIESGNPPAALTEKKPGDAAQPVKAPAAAPSASAPGRPPGEPAPASAPGARAPAQDLSGFSLLDLFKAEVESHSISLHDGLARIEVNPANTDPLDELRRAAHSIKGAARIVGIDCAVKVAHAMEEVFSSASTGKSEISAAKIKSMRAGTEFLSRLSQDAAKIQPQELTGKYEPEAQAWSQALAAACSARTDSGTTPRAAPEPPPAPVPSSNANAANPATARKNQAAIVRNKGAELTGRTVRVNAISLTRLMGLAGEALVEARWLASFEQSLRLLQDEQMQLAAGLEHLNEQMQRSQQSSGTLLHDIQQQSARCRNALAERMHAFEVYALRSDNLSHRLYREVIASRMRPFADGTHGFPRMIHDLARTLEKKTNFEVRGKTTEVDRDILDKLEAPLNHLLRNALDHGMESPQERLAAGKPELGSVVLEAVHKGGMLAVTVTDDGRGIDLERVKRKIVEKKLAAAEMAGRMTEAELLEFLFLPGFTTASKVTEISGRGVGLDVVRNMVAEVGGQIHVTSQLGKGSSFHLQLPITLSVLSALLVQIDGEAYAFPLARIVRVLKIRREHVKTLETHQYVEVDGQNIGLVLASQLLHLETEHETPEEVAVIIVGNNTERYGLAVDQLLGERDVVVRPLDPRLGKVPNISATALMEDGTPLLIVDVEDTFHSIHNLLGGGRLKRVMSREVRKVVQRKRVLVVDDSLTVREVERKLLENKGYEVDLATDGADGWNAIRSGSYDLVISDVDMPRMNGIELVTLIKNDPRYKDIPVMIVSYKDREEDRLKGMEAGANYYLTKSSFQDESLLGAVADLIGEAT